MKAVLAAAVPLFASLAMAMTSKGGRGNKSVSLHMQQWVAQGHSASDIASFLKEQGYKKARVSQLLQELKKKEQEAEAAGAAAGAALFDEHLQVLQKTKNSAKEQAIVKSYIAWCGHSRGLPGIVTPLGVVGLHQDQVLSWLSSLRSHGSSPVVEPKLGAKALANRFSQLRTALCNLGLQGLPLWAQQGCTTPKWIKRQLATWALQDLQENRTSYINHAIIIILLVL